MDTFTPPLNPSINGTSISVAPRVLSTTFGDGYRQTSPDGLNTIVHTHQLAWSSIAKTDAQTIQAFLYAHVGSAFYYTSPLDNVQRKWDWSGLQYSDLSSSVSTISFTLTERFDQVS